MSAEARRVMGDLQHFCLRWNNYQNSITTAFENLRDDEDFIDVTLACDGKSLKAHRVVLSACSPYFRELLKVSMRGRLLVSELLVCSPDLKTKHVRFYIFRSISTTAPPSGRLGRYPEILSDSRRFTITIYKNTRTSPNRGNDRD